MAISYPTSMDFFTFPVNETNNVVRQVRLFVEGPKSEADVAFPAMDKKHERRHRRTQPSAMRQISLVETPSTVDLSTLETIQLTPNRRHATSGFIYLDWLQEYGISEEDWTKFTKQLCIAGWMTRKQIALMLCIALVTECFVIAALPTKIISMGAAINTPLYFYFKRKNLRRHVFDGTIPAWTAFWNNTYFGPKGLAVGFDLPGPVFTEATVVPKPRYTPYARLFKGKFRTKAMSNSRAARRARITIVRVRDPNPEAGRCPRIEPTKIPRIQRVYDRLLHKITSLPIELEKKCEERIASIKTLQELQINARNPDRLHEITLPIPEPPRAASFTSVMTITATTPSEPRSISSTSDSTSQVFDSYSSGNTATTLTPATDTTLVVTSPSATSGPRLDYFSEKHPALIWMTLKARLHIHTSLDDSKCKTPRISSVAGIIPMAAIRENGSSIVLDQSQLVQ